MAGTGFTGPIEVREPSGSNFEEVIRVKTVKLTADQINALETGVEVLAAPEVGKAIVIDEIQLTKEAGTAYTASGNFEFRYTGDAGTLISGVAQTGFSDQTTSETRVLPVYQSAVGTVGVALEPVDNAKVVIHSSGAISGGTGSLFIRFRYHLIDTALDDSSVEL